jgi:hypothetical protein
MRVTNYMPLRRAPPLTVATTNGAATLKANDLAYIPGKVWDHR